MLKKKADAHWTTLRAAFNGHFERASKVLTLLIGGAGAVAAYTVNNRVGLEVPARSALLVLTISWSGIAVFLATWGMRSRNIRSGPELTAMVAIYAQYAGGIEHKQDADATAHALRKVRKENSTVVTCK